MGRLDDFFENHYSALPKWLKVVISVAIALFGVGWVWAVGQLGLHHDIAKLGFIAIAVGICGFGFAMLSDDSGYNF